MLASVCSTKRFVKSGQAKTGAETNSAFSVRNASACSVPHVQRAFFFVSRVSGAAISEKLAMNRRYQEAIPMNCRICFTVRGSGQSATALTFSGSVLISSLSMMCPRYFNLSTQNLHLSGFSRSCAFRRRRKVSVSSLRCSLNVLLITIISSK